MTCFGNQNRNNPECYECKVKSSCATETRKRLKKTTRTKEINVLKTKISKGKYQLKIKGRELLDLALKEQETIKYYELIKDRVNSQIEKITEERTQAMKKVYEISRLKYKKQVQYNKIKGNITRDTLLLERLYK